jgi:ketol-acid reductoisomerase
MRKNLVEDIKNGEFAQEWSKEQAAGSGRLAAMKEAALNNPMNRAEDAIIALVQQAHAL